jgi:uncharacterized damage-inducible protein DinB
MLLAQLRRLFDHAAWANDAVISALQRQQVAADVLELFAHVLGAEEIWLSRLEARRARLAVWPALTVEQLPDAARANAEGYRAYLASLGVEMLDREVEYRNSAGQSFRSRIADILTHVAMHGSYHRGQVAWKIRHEGGEPAPTDFIAFVRGVPAATTRDSAADRG